MSYLGSSAAPLPVAFSGPQSEGFDGGTATFTLSRSVAKVTDIEVVINNVAQSPYDGSYSVSDKTLTTSETVSAGTKNVIVKYRDVSLGSLIPGAGTVGKSQHDVANLDGTGAAQMPVGTTGQRPTIPLAGHYRLNSSTGEPEWYDATRSLWTRFSGGTYTVDALVVAGGGGGGRYGGGGGAGGLLNSPGVLLVSGNQYVITVGAGGIGWVGDAQSGGNAASGSASTLSTLLTSVGGGGAGLYGNPSGSNGAPGGSGGGGANYSSGPATVGGSGTVGQGNAGGGSSGGYGSTPGGGGGGAGAAGAAGQSNGQGGVGVQWLNGLFYAGGGSGNQPSGSLAGGNGGGGTGFGSTATTAADASANTGGGGGGTRDSVISGTVRAGNGGSGVVIIRYFGAQRGTGGTITSTNGYTYHTFTSSGIFTA